MTVRLDSKFSEQTNTCEFRKAVNLAYGQGGLKLEINIPPQHISAKSKGGLIIEGGVSSSTVNLAKCQLERCLEELPAQLEGNCCLRLTFVLCIQSEVTYPNFNYLNTPVI